MAFVVLSLVSNVITQVVVLWYYVAFAAAAYAVTRYRENAALPRPASASRRGSPWRFSGMRPASPGLRSRAPAALREPAVRILHVNKFLYRRGGAEAYMEDVAELQVAAGHRVAFFGMAHPSNTHLEYAAHFPTEIEMEPPPPDVAGPAARGRPDAVVDVGQPGDGRGPGRLPAGRGPPPQHLPPALPLGAPSRRAPAAGGGDDPP